MEVIPKSWACLLYTESVVYERMLSVVPKCVQSLFLKISRLIYTFLPVLFEPEDHSALAANCSSTLQPIMQKVLECVIILIMLTYYVIFQCPK